MAGIKDYVTATTAFFDRQDAAIAGLQGDVKFLNDTILALQNSPGTLTPEDQASLDALQSRAQVVADKLDALDSLTPPVAPPV